ncbi:hypothetical protein PR202_ga19212 [Eleusine coracana subsp. coracana]|uniref:U-box domain-containing protein n=1 Tax=Eleusine coracana subsp. coracana TaxID=191504 RepID=A0AAV5CV07_ELECO|nr:hypothetical protein PR202_ga19212 [Eleusine coracana subsp. coracana]
MAMEEPPELFLCPISMELMEDPVTVSTGVTYDRRSIQRWFFKYGKTTCPATMQRLTSFDLTPNHTLKRVISSWLDDRSSSSSSSSSSSPRPRESLPSVLAGIEDTPFKVTALKKLRSCVAGDETAQEELVACGGVQVLGRVMAQALAESGGDFSAFRTCEEAAAVLAAIPLSDEPSARLLLKPESMMMGPLVALVQRGSAEARLHAMTILAKVSKASTGDWTAHVDDVGELTRSLLELLSDGVASAKLAARALDVLLDVVASPPSRRAKAAAAAVGLGAVRVLVEMLPDAAGDRHVAERALLLLKRLCRCPEGRAAFADHGMGVHAVARTVMRVSGVATRLAVGVLWLVTCGTAAPPRESVLEDMVVSGCVGKLLAVVQVETSPSTKEKAARMLKVHGAFWRQYPCFPTDLRDYLKFLN